MKGEEDFQRMFDPTVERVKEETSLKPHEVVIHTPGVCRERPSDQDLVTHVPWALTASG